MSQLTIYLDEQAMREVKQAAKREHLSVSRWASAKLTHAARRSWPAGYFDLFGALRDTELRRPAAPPLSADTPRGSLS